ncbi:MAG: hypothetical protein HOY79_02295 [Streptomyces sp.]|nr:hypothetical protein [Streptomyces sp.]
MSLPQRSATVAPDPYTTGRALPHTSPDRWLRPYGPGPWRVAAAALALVLASYLMFAAVIMVAAKNVSGAVACLTAAVLIIVAALRLLRMGVWLSAKGLRQTAFLHTVTLRWQQVASVRTAQQPVKVLGLPRTVQGQALLITRRGGQTLRPLLTDHNADFLGRVELFDVAADTIEGWATELR